jgi:hypothetical protein
MLICLSGHELGTQPVSFVFEYTRIFSQCLQDNDAQCYGEYPVESQILVPQELPVAEFQGIWLAVLITRYLSNSVKSCEYCRYFLDECLFLVLILPLHLLVVL